MILLLALCSIAFACNAQMQAQDLYGPIPAWVMIDKALLSETVFPQNPQEQELSQVTRNLTEHPVFEASPFHPAKTSKVSSIDVYRMDNRPANPAFPKESDSPPNSYRPSVDVPGGWRVSMPNLRKNVAKLLLQHSF